MLDGKIDDGKQLACSVQSSQSPLPAPLDFTNPHVISSLLNQHNWTDYFLVGVQ